LTNHPANIAPVDERAVNVTAGEFPVTARAQFAAPRHGHHQMIQEVTTSNRRTMQVPEWIPTLRSPISSLFVPAFPTPRASVAGIAFSPNAVDPLSLIVRAYDRAIRACETFEHADARTAIGVLRAALELDSPSSRSFDALYVWCEECLDSRDFMGPARTLRALRDAWCLASQPGPIVPRAELPVS